MIRLALRSGEIDPQFIKALMANLERIESAEGIRDISFIEAGSTLSPEMDATLSEMSDSLRKATDASTNVAETMRHLVQSVSRDTEYTRTLLAKERDFVETAMRRETEMLRQKESTRERSYGELRDDVTRALSVELLRGRIGHYLVPRYFLFTIILMIISSLLSFAVMVYLLITRTH